MGDQLLAARVVGVEDLVLTAGRDCGYSQLLDVGDHGEIAGIVLTKAKENVFRLLFCESYITDSQNVRTAYAKTVQVIPAVFTSGRDVLCPGGNVERRHRSPGQSGSAVSNAAQHL